MAQDQHESTEEEAMIATLSDYLDDALSPVARAEVEEKLARDPPWQRTHVELLETRKALSGLRKARAPEQFADEVTATIHTRSAGRFFARRTLGDRVPFGVLFVIAAIALLVVGYVMWSSHTGSLKVERGDAPPAPSEPLLRP